MAGKIYIIGADAKDALLLATMKEKYGDDIILVTPDQAKEQGLNIDDIANIPTMKITAPPIIPVVEWAEYKTGKEQRRERRKKERMLNKRKTEDGGYKEQLWVIVSDLHDMFYNGQNYMATTWIALLNEA